MANPLSRAARAVADIFTRAPRSTVPVASGSIRYGFVGYGGPAEPFAGAWQKGIKNASPGDPNILAFSAVYACVTIISQDIAKMPMRVVEIGGDGVSETVAVNSPYHRLVRKPNWYQTSIDFTLLWTACKLLRGNAYGFKEFDERGVPRSIHILHPDRVTVMIEPVSKEVFYQFTPNDSDMFKFGDGFFSKEGTVFIPSRFIIHDKINTLWHPLIGVSPLFAAAISAATGGRILLNTERLFANMSRPSGALTAPGEISETTAERLKREFESNYSAGGFGRTAVLGDGLKWEPMVITSTDAQLIEQLKFTVEDVARSFRVPMYLLADVTRMTYKNSEQAAQSYFSGCLQYHVESTEAVFTDTFSLPTNQHVAFDVRGLFRMDTQERFAAYKEGVNGGILSPNEARAMEGLGPVKGGEEPRMQMQYVPLSQAPAYAPAPAPAPADDNSDDDVEDDVDESKAVAELISITTRAAQNVARATALVGEK